MFFCDDKEPISMNIDLATVWKDKRRNVSEFKIYLLSSIADVLTKIMSSVATVIVIPEVVPCPGEEWVMVLSHHKAVLAMVVVGLAVSPVKPINCGVHVLPHPVSRGSLTVSLLQWAKIFITNSNVQYWSADLSVASKPKLGVLSNLCCCQQFVLQPVVYSFIICLRNLTA